MIFLINCSNLDRGGSLQVADSICCGLNRYPQHRFCVVLSPQLALTAKRIERYDNVHVHMYSFKNNDVISQTQREPFLDSLVDDEKIDAVLTVFGPSVWSPRCPHVSGFARPYVVLEDNPFFERMKLDELTRAMLNNYILRRYFDKSSNVYFTESPFISKKLKEMFPKKQIYTVSNCYHQVFDHPEKQKEKTLPPFNGVTLLTVSAYYPHKNLGIIKDVSAELQKRYPEFKYRFVLTLEKQNIPELKDCLDEHIHFIGKVDIAEVPSLYQQCDICFMPSLQECFSATYPEAMRSQKPIITTDLDFARCLCGNAASYYSPLSANDAAKKIMELVNSPEQKKQLVEHGKHQLLCFDSHETRLHKLIKILENEVNLCK